MRGIDWAITELKLAITISRTAHTNAEVKTWVFKEVFLERRRTPSFYHIFLIYSYTKNREKKNQSFSREYNPSRSLGLDIFQQELFSFIYHSLSSDYFDYPCNV